MTYLAALAPLGILLAWGEPVLCQGAASAPASRPARVLETAIELGKRDHPKVDAATIDSEIARLADLWRKRAGENPSPEKSVEALRGVLFEDVKFTAVAELDSAETLHIDSVLKTKRGYCLSLSVVALAIAERVGIPLYGVAMPNHFFVRFDDGRARKNVELTRQGAEIADSELTARMGQAPSAGSIYLRNLTSAEVGAIFLHNRGFVAMADGRKADALADLTEAVRLLPQLPEAHRNLGVLLGEEGKFAQARSEFDAALRLYSDDVEALVNRALCRQRLDDAAGALADLDIALLLDPSRKRALELRERIGKETREHDWTAWQRTAVLPLDKPPAAEPGLDVRYFAGVNFDREVARRVDREIDFDWKRAAPARGVPADQFSFRAEGWFKAVKGGKYTFFVVSNDGARLTLDDRVWLENWRDQGYENWFGSIDIPLVAGWHRIRLEHFEARGGARLLLRIGVDGEEKTLKQSECLFHTPPKAPGNDK